MTISDNGNGVVILHRKRYDKNYWGKTSDTFKLEKLKENLTFTREALLQRFLQKLTQKNIFDEIEYDKLYLSGSAPART